MKFKLSILVAVIAIVVSLLNHKFIGSSKSMDIILVLMAVATIVYIWIADWLGEAEAVEGTRRPDEYTREEEDVRNAFMVAITGQSQEEDPKYKTGKPHFIVQPMLVVSDKEFNEKTNIEMEKPTPKAELKEAPKKEIGVSSYSVNGIPTKYRRMFDDFHSFAITHGPKTEDELIAKLAPFGHPYKIERSGSLVAFNLGFIRMPLNGFLSTK